MATIKIKRLNTLPSLWYLLQTQPYLTQKSSVDVQSIQTDPDSAESLAAFNGQYEGYCADLAKMISDAIGFRYRIVPVEDEKYGAQDQITKEWNGMVGELIRHVSLLMSVKSCNSLFMSFGCVAQNELDSLLHFTYWLINSVLFCSVSRLNSIATLCFF